MKSHADSDLDIVPTGLLKPLLGIQRRRRSVLSPRKRRGERVPTRREHITTLSLNRRSDDLIVLGESARHSIPVLLPQPG